MSKTVKLTLNVDAQLSEKLRLITFINKTTLTSVITDLLIGYVQQNEGEVQRYLSDTFSKPKSKAKIKKEKTMLSDEDKEKFLEDVELIFESNYENILVEGDNREIIDPIGLQTKEGYFFIKPSKIRGSIENAGFNYSQVMNTFGCRLQKFGFNTTMLKFPLK